MENADLMKAASEGDTERVTALLNGGADVNARDESGMTALIQAAKGNHIESMRVLLERGADVNAKGRFLGYEAIILAVKANSAEAVELLLAHGFDPASTDMNFIIGVARLTGNARILELLDQAKARLL
ncbi:MAG: ankyrin repeat domain-containing protein [Acidobacteriota bacterium]